MSLVLMMVHAHPDDEATGTGGALAKYASEGIETVLVTCTDGSCGDGPGGIKPDDPAHDRAAVVEMRKGELAASCAVLSVTHAESLGYADSGMMGWATNDEPNAFWNTPVEEAAARLADLMRTYRPDVVVTYDDFGFYGHPDHIQAHRITMAAVEQTGIPKKVYWTTAPRSMFEEFQKMAAEFGVDMDEEDNEPPTDENGVPHEIGLPDDEITTWIDTKAFGHEKFAALSAHSSQGDNIFFLHLGEERFTEMMGVETYVRVQDSTDAPVPEDDLFAGLR